MRRPTTMSERSRLLLQRKLRAFERRRREFMAGFDAGKAGVLGGPACFKDYAKTVIGKEELLDE